MKIDLRILRYDPERDKKPHWQSYVVEADPEADRVLDLLHRVKYEHDGSLTFRRSCAHGICGSDAVLINGRNRLACKERIEKLGRRISVAPLPGLPVVKDLVVDMDGFFDSYKSVMPFLVTDQPAPGAGAHPVGRGAGPLRRHHEVHPVRRVHDVVSVVLVQGGVRRACGDRQRPSIHLRLARRARRRAARDPCRRRRRLALPDDLQLHRRLPARDPHHPGDPRGQRGDRGATAIAGREPDDPLTLGLDAPDSPTHPVEAPSPVGRPGPRIPHPDRWRRAGQPGSRVRRRGPDPARSPRCHGIRAPGPTPACRSTSASGPTTSPSTSASSVRSRWRANSGAERVEMLLEFEAHRRTAGGPLAGQGRQAPAALGRGPPDVAGVPAGLDRRACPARPERRSPTHWPMPRSTGSPRAGRRSSIVRPD